jgi:hypothetical protein
MMSLMSKLKAKPLSDMEMKAVAGGEICEPQYADTWGTTCSKATGECWQVYYGQDYVGEVCY